MTIDNKTKNEKAKVQNLVQQDCEILNWVPGYKKRLAWITKAQFADLNIIRTEIWDRQLKQLILNIIGSYQNAIERRHFKAFNKNFQKRNMFLVPYSFKKPILSLHFYYRIPLL